MNSRVRTFWTVVALAAFAAGCNREVEPVVPVTPVSTVAPAAEKPENHTAPTPATDADLAKAPAAKNGEPSMPTATAFTPPFPDRLDLFEPPKRAQSTIRRDDEHGETVELKGFINVDTPRVILSIDGVVSPVPEGGEKYGVKVISIQPPSVVLQRDRHRWTATLE